MSFWALFTLLCAVCALHIGAGLDRDEGAFLTIAQLTLHGRIPYRDVFDQKPPGIYYLLAALLTLTRPLSLHAQILVMRLAAVAANALSGVGLLRLGARWSRPEAGRLAALFWLAACAISVFGSNQLFTEPFATVATIWAVERVANRATIRAGLEAGLLLALGAFFKQTAVLALPSLGLLIWSQPAGKRAYTFGALLAGAGLPWLVLLGVYALLGAAGALVYQVVIVNLVGYPEAPVASLPIFLTLTLGFLYCGPLALALLRLLARARQRRMQPHSVFSTRRKTILIGTALALMLILQTAPMLAHPYPHYLIQALPWLALLLALGVAPEEKRSAERGFLAWGGVALRLTLTALPLLIGVATALASAPVESAALGAQLARGAWIAAHTPVNADLLIAPAEPEYYYLAGRLPTTPYVYLLPVNHATYPLANITEEIRARRFAVVVRGPNYVQNDSPQQYAAMEAALNQSYYVAPGNDKTVIVYQR